MDIRCFGANLADATRNEPARASREREEDAYYRRHSGTGLLLRGIQSAIVAVLAVAAVGWVAD
jgi:hypothetical protein